MTIINTIFMFSTISMSSSNIITMWYYMEIASFIFIFYLIKKKNPIESCVIYFIISFIASMIILSTIIFSNYNSMEMNIVLMKNMNYMEILPLAFFLKMGVIPVHSWIFKMTENMEWNSLILLFSIQKFIPIWGILCFSKTTLSFLFIIMNSILSPFLPMKSKNVFFLISTSSIINSIWIIMSSICSSITTFIFSISYFIMNSNLILIFKKENSKKNSNKNQIHTLLSMLSILGFPPLPNFFLKLFILKNIFCMYTSMLFFSIIILISNMISSIMYMKFILISVVNLKMSFASLTLSKNLNLTNNFINMSPMIFMIIFLNN